MPKADTGETVHIEYKGDSSGKTKGQAKKQLNKVANRMVTVVVVHKDTGKNTYGRVKVRDVRRYAETAVNQFKETKPQSQTRKIKASDFFVIEVHDTGKVKVTTLE